MVKPGSSPMFVDIISELPLTRNVLEGEVAGCSWLFNTLHNKSQGSWAKNIHQIAAALGPYHAGLGITVLHYIYAVTVCGYYLISTIYFGTRWEVLKHGKLLVSGNGQKDMKV